MIVESIKDKEDGSHVVQSGDLFPSVDENGENPVSVTSVQIVAVEKSRAEAAEAANTALIAANTALIAAEEARALAAEAVNTASIVSIEATTDFITVTQAVDLDSIESDTATNNSKVSNATHTGDVTGSTDLTIANNAVSNAKAADMVQSTIKGRVSGAGTGDPTDLSGAQAIAAMGITSTIAELNKVDGSIGATATTVVAADRVVFNDNGTMKQVAMSDIKAYVASVLNTKVIDLGAWNMVGNKIKSFAHGLTSSKIRTVQVSIVPDSGFTQTYDYGAKTSVESSTSNISWDTTNITLTHAAGGAFDNVAFDDPVTPNNRGWITIWYTD